VGASTACNEDRRVSFYLLIYKIKSLDFCKLYWQQKHIEQRAEAGGANEQGKVTVINNNNNNNNNMSRDSVVNIETGYSLDDGGVGVQTGSGVQPTSYSMDTEGSLPGDKAARARS
jgi:hypothetical protein